MIKQMAYCLRAFLAVVALLTTLPVAAQNVNRYALLLGIGYKSYNHRHQEDE